VIHLLLGLLLLIPTLGQAATGSAAVDTWYVRPTAACANNGDGLTYACAASEGASGAFRDPSNIIWTSTTGVDDGDTLYVCGSHLDTVLAVGTVAGTRTLPITISFSCPSDRGSIRAVHNMTEALTANNWTNESGSLWYLSVASYTWKDPRRVWVDGSEIFAANAKNALGTRIGSGSAPVSTWFYDSGTDRLYLYSSSNPASTFTSLHSLVAGAGTCAYTAMCLNSASIADINIVNPILEGGNFGSIYNLGPSRVAIYGTETDDSLCQIGKDSTRGVLFSDTAGNGTGTASYDLSIQDCTVDQVIPTQFSGYAWEWNAGIGDGVHLLTGTIRPQVISNTIQNWLHGAVTISATQGTTSVTHALIEGNTITCDNQVSYCRAFGISGTALGQAAYNRIQRNLVSSMSIRSQINGDHNLVIGNIFKDQRPDIIYTDRTESLETQAGAAVSQDNVIAHNTFLNNLYAPCLSLRGGAEGTVSGNQYLNNLLINCGGSTYTAGYENVALSVPSGAGIGNNVFRGNLIYDSGQTNTVYYKATGKTTVAGFQSACSGDACSGNLSSNPLLTSDTDLRLKTTSPGHRAGSSSVCLDYRGRACPSDRPNIGAYQSTSGDPAATRAARN